MKKIYLILALALTLGFVSCDEEYVTYSDAEYVMFAQEQSENLVLADAEYFTVPVASTVACDYDRTFGVEVVDKRVHTSVIIRMCVAEKYGVHLRIVKDSF